MYSLESGSRTLMPVMTVTRKKIQNYTKNKSQTAGQAFTVSFYFMVLIMAAFNKKFILYAAIGVMGSNRQKQLFKKKQVKRFWRRGIFRDRKLYSEYYTLYQQLRNSDRELHYRYLRMSKERFDHLLTLIRDKITKNDTKLREAITAEERLVITLRYLASGMSQQDLCYNFRVGRTTASNIVSEVCIALYDVLSPIYLRPPTTEIE